MAKQKISFRTIFENMGTASVIIDEGSFILCANKKFEELSGYKRQELEGRKKWKEFVHEDDLSKIEGCLWQQDQVDNENKDECEFRFVDYCSNIKHILAVIMEIPRTDTAVVSLLDITQRKLAEEALKQRDQQLEMKSQSLEEANIALKVLLKRKEEDKANLEEQMIINLKTLIVPFISNLKGLTLNNGQMIQVKALEKQLHDITSPFLRRLSVVCSDLSFREIQVASLIKEGMTTKEMATLLNIAESSIDFHRKNIRCKLGITSNANINLRTYLLSLSL